MLILLLQVILQIDCKIGVPLSGGSTRSEPNKSAIDLAVKALKEKERQKGYEWNESCIVVLFQVQVSLPTNLKKKRK